MSFCRECISGARHEGTPEGKFEDIGGVRCYVGTPTVDYPKDKAILFLADVYGIDSINAKLLVDDFARNGFKVVAMDYLNGGAIPVESMDDPTFDFGAWISKHNAEVTRPPLNKVIAALEKQGVKDFAATGYCFGGRYVFDLAFDKVIKVAAVAHPSLLKLPEDLHKISYTKVPVLINSCTFDSQFPLEAQAQADIILGGGYTSTNTYKREYFEGCTHGFAIRGDLGKPEVRAAKEGAFKATVEFFMKHL